MRHARMLGPIFSRKFFGTEIVFVCGADLVAELSDETRFAKHLAPALERLRALVGDGLVTAYNEEPTWRLAHDILQPAFSTRAMRSYHETMLAVAGRLITRWDRAAGVVPVNVVEDMTRLTLDTIGLTGFGYDFASFSSDELHPAAHAMSRVLAYFQAGPRAVPWIGRVLDYGAHRRFVADAELMMGFADTMIRERKEQGGPADLLGLMLSGPDSGGRLRELNVRNQVITLLIAGHETTASAISFSLYYLLKNPHALARAAAEVDAMWPAQDDPQPGFADVGKLRYIRQVVYEALRLSPPAPAFARKARADTVLGGRYPVERDQWVLVLTPALHRDPVWGDDTEAFDPERFRPEAVRARPPHAFKAFGTGLRACIGRQFALHEATLVLAMLVHRYRLLDPSSGYQLRTKEGVTLKPADFRLGLTRRTAAERLLPGSPT